MRAADPALPPASRAGVRRKARQTAGRSCGKEGSAAACPAGITRLPRRDKDLRAPTLQPRVGFRLTSQRLTPLALPVTQSWAAHSRGPSSSTQARRQRAPSAPTARRARDRGERGRPRLGGLSRPSLRALGPTSPPRRGGAQRRARGEGPRLLRRGLPLCSASSQSPNLSVPLFPRLQNEGNDRAQFTALLMQVKHINMYEALRKVPRSQ